MFLLIKTDSGQTTLERYFHKNLNCLTSIDDKELLVYFPLKLLPKDLEGREETRVLRALKSFAKSILIGTRPKLEATFIENKMLGYFVPGTKKTKTLKELIKFYRKG